MIGRTNAEIPGSDNITYVHYPTATAGVTVTASKTGATKTAVTDANGVATFKHLELGYTWTFTASNKSVSKYLGDIEVNVYMPIAVEIYTRKIDDDESPEWYHFTEPRWNTQFNMQGYDAKEVVATINMPRRTGTDYSYVYWGTVDMVVGEVYGHNIANMDHLWVNSEPTPSVDITNLVIDNTQPDYIMTPYAEVLTMSPEITKLYLWYEVD